MRLGVNGTINSIIFHPIDVTIGTTIASAVDGNVIRNIQLRSTSSTPFAAIFL
jgi:hypothetical protein